MKRGNVRTVLFAGMLVAALAAMPAMVGCGIPELLTSVSATAEAAAFAVNLAGELENLEQRVASGEVSEEDGKIAGTAILLDNLSELSPAGILQAIRIASDMSGIPVNMTETEAGAVNRVATALAGLSEDDLRTLADRDADPLSEDSSPEEVVRIIKEEFNIDLAPADMQILRDFANRMDAEHPPAD